MTSTYNQLLKHRSGHFVAYTGQPLLRSVCRLAKRYAKKMMNKLYTIVCILILSTPLHVNAGAWGYGPRESDAGLDLLLELNSSDTPLKDVVVILETYGEGYEAEVRFACDYLITELKDKVKLKDLVVECISLVQGYHDDPEYLEAWEDEKAIKKALMIQIKKLKAFNI